MTSYTILDALGAAILENPELADMAASGTLNDLIAALKKLGMSFDEKELQNAIQALEEQEKRPLSDTDLDYVVGGAGSAVNIKFTNNSSPSNNNVVIFKKTAPPDFSNISIAWKVIKNIGRSDHNFEYPL